jgi:hypothetical protein
VLAILDYQNGAKKLAESYGIRLLKNSNFWVTISLPYSNKNQPPRQKDE